MVEEPDTIMGRLGAALARAEAALPALPQGGASPAASAEFHALSARHAALCAAVRGAIVELDGLIAEAHHAEAGRGGA